MKKIAFAFIASSLLFFLFFVTRIGLKPSHRTIETAETMFGIDVSQYQGTIDWKTVAAQEKPNVRFAFIRATMGNRRDKRFSENWDHAKNAGIIVGAYHYYDPNENSIAQAKNYLHAVTLQKGDFIPVVDIERLSRVQPNDRLWLGLQRWLDAVEAHYGVKPIIYSGHKFFETHLGKKFGVYPLWIASYSAKRQSEPTVVHAQIHQFTDNVRIDGISETVDGNNLRKNCLDSLVIR